MELEQIPEADDDHDKDKSFCKELALNLDNLLSEPCLHHTLLLGQRSYSP
jgi:hypothetical protein